MTITRALNCFTGRNDMRKLTLDCGLIDTAAGLHLQLSELLDPVSYTHLTLPTKF